MLQLHVLAEVQSSATSPGCAHPTCKQEVRPPLFLVEAKTDNLSQALLDPLAA